MTWTCKNRPLPCGPLCAYENSDANVGCLNCGATKPAELGEEERATLLRLRRWANGIREAKLLNDGHVEPAELGEDERAAWELMDKHRRAVGWDRVSISEASPSALKFAVGFCKDARAPLEAEKRRLEAELAIRRAEASSLRRRLELAQAEKPGAPPSGKPEYWQALRWGADLVASRGDSQVSAELAAPFYKLAREIEGAICKEWGTNGPTGEPAAPAGLPEVGTEVEVWEEPSYNLTVKAVKDEVVGYDMDRRRLFRTKQHGVFSVELEGTSWRRLPPAQTSREPVAERPGFVGTEGEAMSKLLDELEARNEPAASPPGEVTITTENLSAWYDASPVTNQWISVEKACQADIRANLERESAKWERLVDEWGKRFQAKEDRIAELTEKLQRQTDARIGWEKDCGEVCKQRDAALAEVERFRAELRALKEINAETIVTLTGKPCSLAHSAEVKRVALAEAERLKTANAAIATDADVRRALGDVIRECERLRDGIRALLANVAETDFKNFLADLERLVEPALAQPQGKVQVGDPGATKGEG